MPADEDVVHGALAGGGNHVREGLGEGAEEDVGDALGGLDVAGGDGGGRSRVHQAALGGDDGDGSQDALVGGRGLADDAAEDVEGGGERDGKGRVDAAASLGGGLGEVEGHGVAADGDGDGDGDRLVGEAVVVHDVAEGVVAVGQGADGGAGEALGVVEEGGLVLVDDGPAVAVDHLLEAALAGAAGGDLGGEVAAALVGRAGVAAEEGDDLLVDLAGADELERRDDEALLEELGRAGEGAGGHAADVGVVCAVGDEADEGLAAGGVCPSICGTGRPFDRLRANVHPSLRGGEDGGDEGDVVEVGAAEVGVVEGDDVAGVELEALEGGGDGSGHGAEVDGDVGGLRDHVAVWVKEGAGVVLALLDVGGEAGAAKGDAHLLGDGGEEVLEDLEGYGVYGHFSLAPGALGLDPLGDCSTLRRGDGDIVRASGRWPSCRNRSPSSLLGCTRPPGAHGNSIAATDGPLRSRLDWHKHSGRKMNCRWRSRGTSKAITCAEGGFDSVYVVSLACW